MLVSRKTIWSNSFGVHLLALLVDDYSRRVAEEGQVKVLSPCSFFCPKIKSCHNFLFVADFYGLVDAGGDPVGRSRNGILARSSILRVQPGTQFVSYGLMHQRL